MAKLRESKRFIWVTWLIKLLSGTIGASGGHGSRPTITATLGPGRTPILIMSDGKWSTASCCGSPGRDWKSMGILWGLRSRTGSGLKGESTMVGGQPDLVSEKHGDITVIDVKTGTPRQWDIIQVMLYVLIRS